MPDAPAISVHGVSKRYSIGHQVRHDTLRDRLAHGARHLLRRLVQREPETAVEDFWALRDVSFDVARGEVVGIIGRNGAGKSTLLKILSRITESTTGRVVLRGRVASLLEVGTGFHPDLTGRENIRLNGSILGMSRAEIEARFDEIVAFAEIERFLDTPVKRYSSGMYVRLAFAVAAHLDPEILIVDEVLAVGDAEFQKKCLGKMREVARGGERTVLFVSHNLAAVQTLCDRGVYLAEGRVHRVGTAAECVTAYLEKQGTGATGIVNLAADVGSRPGDGRARLAQVELLSVDGASRSHFAIGEPFTVRLTVRVHAPLRQHLIGFSINTLDGQPIVCSNQHDDLPSGELPVGLHVFSARVESLWLSPGRYGLTAAISGGDHHVLHDAASNCLTFEIDPRAHDTSVPVGLLDGRPGYLRPPLRWKLHTTLS